ncbi:DUF4192 domain-containing protein [Nocardia cyriacigeorgica]|uniref:DUF4192 domain-containing protein n=1 Tax=Nocardia cyriacigeorgica TaxID=135487 RepID=UPI001894722B|nr:DUF4192 domain-containing protein [Nocardia cyriacigeorgica]MBF6324775.1 DUF4192 domain-containing protein [Nocardia cyriacigeorgica]
MSESTVRADDPGDLIAAIPSMLSFPPTRSLVVITLRHRDVAGRDRETLVETVARFDLGPDQERLARTAVRACIRGTDAVMVVFVDDGATPEDAQTQRRLLRMLTDGFTDAGVRVAGAWATSRIEAGLPWQAVTNPAFGGTLPDPMSGAVAAATAAGGGPIRRSREEITALVALDSSAAAQLDTVLPVALDEIHQRWRLASDRGELDAIRREAIEFILDRVRDISRGEHPGSDDLARIALTVGDGFVGLVMLAVSAGEHAHAAEALWLRLTRCLRGAVRAEPAALLAYSAYLRGDGSLATSAIKAAFAADPDHPLADLLADALRDGYPHSMLRALADRGIDTATQLGIDLPRHAST